MARPGCVVGIGIAAYFVLYFFQVGVLVYYMAEHVHNLWGLIGIGYLLSPLFLAFNRCFRTPETRRKAVRRIWFVWLLYIIALVVSIVVIFSSVVNKLDPSMSWGPNALKTVLCITPVLLILLLNTAIPVGNQKFVQRLSVSAVLDLFDGIEMLEIILMQRSKNKCVAFDLPRELEICIIVFVCIGFLLSPMSMFQHKVNKGSHEVVTRKKTLIIRTSLQVLFVNVAFLVVRCIVWAEHDYDASIFITKNILSIIISGVEILSVFNCCECGASEKNDAFNV